jgi:hypothetical protein
MKDCGLALLYEYQNKEIALSQKTWSYFHGWEKGFVPNV